MDFEITTARPRHSVAGICHIINAAYGRAPWLQDGVDRITPEQVNGILDHPLKRLYLGHRNQVLLGTVLLDASQGYVEMSALAVHPEHQGQSIGAGLMRHAEQETQVHWGRTELYIEIIPFMQESLVGYYLRNGFLRTDDPPLPFPEPAIVMPEYLDRLQLHRMRKPLGSLPVGEST